MNMAGERKSVMEEAAFRRTDIIIDTMKSIKEFVTDNVEI